MSAGGTYDLFISYDSQDGELAASIASQLQALGVNVFSANRSLAPAATYLTGIHNALNEAKLVLFLMTEASKSNLWVHAKAGAAWILNKKRLPAFIDVRPDSMIDILRLEQGPVLKSVREADTIVDTVCGVLGIDSTRDAAPVSRRKETFHSPSDWARLGKTGPWSMQDGLITGQGMHHYLLSQGHFAPTFTVHAVLRFTDLVPVNNLDAVNAGIVLAWTTPRTVRRYFHILMNHERLRVELIGDRGGDAYNDYLPFDPGVPFKLKQDETYAVDVTANARDLGISVRSRSGTVAHDLTLPEMPVGRVGLRPWRSRIECEAFEIASG